ncbi:MAG TPA: ATP-binding protein [Gemmataceae bacterium]|jgi:DNA helicase HerA-like ATPase|nr:ATP-binding protein [Gemmataceae bacterium]
MAEADQEARLLGHVAWDGSTATSERVLLRTSIMNRRLVERNQYVRIQEDDGVRSGFLARVISGPFFHRSGTPTVGGLTAGHSLDCFLLAELEIQGELVGGRPRDTNSRPAPGAPVLVLNPTEVADLHGFRGDMLLGNLSGQDDLWVHLQSQNKSVLPRNLGIFGTVGSGKSNTSQVIIEEAAKNGWAVIVLDVESEYTDMDLPSDEEGMMERLARFGRQPAGLTDFHVFCPASCTTDKAGSETFTLRLADFETSVIGEIVQVSLAERNALLDCSEYLLQKARTKVATNEPEGLETLLDASPQAKLPFTLRTLRERASERASRGTEFFDYSGLATKLGWLLQAQAFDQVNMPSLDLVRMMAPGRVNVIDVSLANDVVKNMVTADLLRKTFALKMTRPNTPPTLLVIEEAHSFISRERVQTMQATLHMLRNITRRGRKRWLAMAFVSQQPGHLPPEIFELCNTRIVHTLRSMHNLEALIATTGEVGRDLWARCPLLGQGQAVLSSPQLNRSVIMSVRPAACRRKFAH